MSLNEFSFTVSFPPVVVLEILKYEHQQVLFQFRTHETKYFGFI